MSDEENIPPWPHKPAPPERKRVIPEWAMLWRGLALAGAGLLCIAGEARLLRSAKIVGIGALPVLGAATVLFGWAAAIHLTGGERFDDHKWV